MATVTWGPELAASYDARTAALATPAVLGPMLEVLAELAGEDGSALEFAIGTGRVALPLSQRGIVVSGIELSPHMVEQLRAKPGAEALAVKVGDMATTTIGRAFDLVYLVANTIMNVTTQDEQAAVFANAAAHLRPGGAFVIDVVVPALRRVSLGARGDVFAMEDDHVGIETYDDPIGQIAWSHHWWAVDGQLVHHSAPYRYVWASELDLMARLAGMRLEHRWGDWSKATFTADCPRHVSVWRRN